MYYLFYLFPRHRHVSGEKCAHDFGHAHLGGKIYSLLKGNFQTYDVEVPYSLGICHARRRENRSTGSTPPDACKRTPGGVEEPLHFLRRCQRVQHFHHRRLTSFQFAMHFSGVKRR